MNRVRHDLRLTGSDAAPGTIGARALRDVLGALVESAQRALRLAVEGRSTRAGTPPAWLRRATDFVVTGLDAGSTKVPFEAPRLGDAAPEVVRQRDLWLPTPDPDGTALALLAEAVRDLHDARRDSDRLDRGLLDALAAFGAVVRGGVAIRVRDEARATDFTIDADTARQAKALRDATPAPRAVVLVGRITDIGARPLGFEMLTADEHAVRGRIAGEAVDPERLRALWKEKATIQGQAHFTAGGHVRFIEARVVRPFEERDRPFAKSKAEVEREAGFHAPASSTPRHGAGDAIRSIWGAWPGDESIDELLEMLD
jgi:hypothetical protein